MPNCQCGRRLVPEGDEMSEGHAEGKAIPKPPLHGQEGGPDLPSQPSLRWLLDFSMALLSIH